MSAAVATIEYIDPRAEPGIELLPYTPRLEAEAPVIGLLANGFPDSAVFLEALSDAISKLAGPTEFRRYAKPNASMVATDQLLDGIAAECAAVITAYGH